MRIVFLLLPLLIMSSCSSTKSSGAKLIDSETILARQAEEYATREADLEKLAALSVDAQSAAKEKARKHAEKAKSYFDVGQFKKALPHYSKSVQLDPSADRVYYQFAVTLYKLKDYARAGNILQMLDGSDSVDKTELHYYQGLNAYKGQDTDSALIKFKNVREDKDPNLSPLASMYVGLIEASNENYTDAKTSFEYVLDNSNDKDLDARAEKYIESLIKRQTFSEAAKQKWSYSVYAGGAYDGNVLNSANLNAAPEAEAYRLMYGGNLSYKALYTRRHTLIPQLSLSDMYSFNSDFKEDSTIQAADPLQGELAIPYRYTLNSGSLTVTPSYQVLYMSLTDGSRDLVFDSTFVSTQWTTSHVPSWISDYKLELASDNSHIVIANPEDDQSAIRYSLLVSQTKLFDNEGYKTLAFDLIYTVSDTEGDNFRYDKYLLAIGGAYPLSTSRKWLSYGRMDYYNMDFADSTLGREDKGFIVTLGANRVLGSKAAVNLNFQYYNNDSTVELYNYDKFVVSAIYQFSSGFF